MNSVRSPQVASAIVALLFIISMVGCDEPGTETGSARAAPGAVAASGDPGPQTSPVPVDLSEGWCGGHGVPESVCTRCTANLIPQFKEAGDWCSEHSLPESQC